MAMVVGFALCREEVLVLMGLECYGCGVSSGHKVETQ